MKRCFSCQQELRFTETPGSRATCPYCHADLHCCFNCRHYSPTASQQCLVPELEPVKSKPAANDCTAFRFREFQAQTPPSAEEQTRKRLDDLFRNL